MNKTTKQPFSSSPEKGFREAIEEILTTEIGRTQDGGVFVEKPPNEIIDQILSLLESSLPKEEVVEDLKGQVDYGYMQGWNACRQAMLDNLLNKGKSNE